MFITVRHWSVIRHQWHLYVFVVLLYEELRENDLMKSGWYRKRFKNMVRVCTVLWRLIVIFVLTIKIISSSSVLSVCSYEHWFIYFSYRCYGYSHLKEEALDRTMWRNRFGRGFGPVVRQNTEWILWTVPYLKTFTICPSFKAIMKNT
jgi:hypothetical protein